MKKLRINHREDSGRNATSIGVGIFISRITALLRESFLAAYLGTRAGGDAFGAALRIPKVLQNLLGEGSLSASFIPVYSQLLEEGDKKRAQNVAGAVLGLLIVLIGALTTLTVFLARPLTSILVPGFSGAKHELTITLLRIMAPGIGLIVLAAWCLGILNSHRRFFLSFVAPALWSTAIVVVVAIGAIANFSDTSIAKAAAYGVLIGGGLQFLVQLPFTIKLAGRIRLTLNVRIKAVSQIFRRFGPAVAGRGVVTLGSYIDLIFASLLATGAVAILDRAHTLYLFPISLFALSIAAADLPEISREVGNPQKIYERITKGVQRVIFFLLFTAIIFTTGGHSIISAIYERVNFTSDDTLVVWLVLAAYSLGILASGISRILQNASYGMGDVKNPARIAFVRMVISSALGLVLMLQFDNFGVLDGKFYQTEDIPAFTTNSAEVINGMELRHLGAVGLALGAMLGAWVELSLLRRLLKKRLNNALKDAGENVGKLSFARNLVKLVPGALGAAILAVGLSILVAGLPGLLGAPIVILPSGIIYILISVRFGNPQAKSIWGTVQKIGRSIFKRIFRSSKSA